MYHLVKCGKYSEAAKWVCYMHVESVRHTTFSWAFLAVMHAWGYLLLQSTAWHTCPYVHMLQLRRKCGETLKEKDKKRWEDFIVHFLDHGQLRVRIYMQALAHAHCLWLCQQYVELSTCITLHRTVPTNKPAWTTKVHCLWMTLLLHR